MKLTAREETIHTLLTWYTAALEGWQEAGRGAGDLGAKMMSRAWNSPSYQELYRCLIRLRDEENRLYWHIRERFMSGNRTVLACPYVDGRGRECGQTTEVAAKHFSDREDGRHVTLKHKHDGGSVFFVLRSVPSVSAAVRPEMVLAGIRWLGREFGRTGRGYADEDYSMEPFVPAALVDKEKRAA